MKIKNCCHDWNAWRPFSVRVAHTLGKRKNKKAEAKAPAFLFVV